MKADRLVLIAMSTVLIAMAVPLTPVSAHTCTSVVPVPHTPPDPNTGCDPFYCPPPSNTHWHITTIATCTNATLNPCPDQPVHNYGAGGSAGGRSATVTGGDDFGVGVVTVFDTNTGDCGTGPGGWDGDYDWGVGGGAFGFGQWATDPDCNYLLNVHGGNVVVNDLVFGNAIGFVVGEDDQSGPVKVTDPNTGVTVCETSGSISPGDPATDPTADADDCLSQHYVGTGATCGSGGGDGLYWVFLDGAFVEENGGVAAGNPPTTGTITAF